MAALFVLLLAAPPAAAQDSTFLLTATAPRYRHPASLGNGRFAVLTTPRGTGPALSLHAGLYDETRGDVPRVAALPAWTEIDVHDGAAWLGASSLDDSVLRSYRQTVDMRDGAVHTAYEWVDGDRRTSVRVHAFVSRADPRLAAVRLVLVPHHAGRVRVAFTLRPWPAPRRLRLAELERVDPSWGPAELWYPGHMTPRSSAAEPRAGGGRLWLTSVPDGDTTTVAEGVEVVWPRRLAHASARAVRTDTLVALEVAFDAAPETSYTFDKLVTVVASSEVPAALPRALADVRRARARGYDALFAAHAAAWHALWATDVVLERDPELQRLVHAMLFYLLGSARAGSAWSIPPMGLSSAGYYGHVFWDADTWMFPALLLTHPDVARSLLGFRWRTLDEARRNARANGFRGAMYPWEAGRRGEETTPRFARQNASSEIHVTGDVALAQWQYFLATGDTAWLARYGYPVLRETADFWASRATLDTARGRYAIRDVVSVDEGLVGITNDAYTNAVARRNLDAAATAARLLGLPPHPLWREVATRLYIPYDTAGQFHRTYERAPPTTLGSVVPLLAYPLDVPMTPRAKRTDLDHAVRRLAAEGSGAMMTVTLYPVVAAELGDRALVDTLLPQTYRGYVREPFLVLGETPSSDAVNFLTGAGGFLQQLLYGYTGLRLGPNGVTPAFRPLLPSRLDRLLLRNVPIRGRRFDVIVEGDSLRMISRRARPAAPAAPPRRARAGRAADRR